MTTHAKRLPVRLLALLLTAALLLSLASCKKKEEAPPAGTLPATNDPATPQPPADDEQPVYDSEQVRHYADTLMRTDVLAFLSAYPSGDSKTDADNLFRFAFHQAAFSTPDAGTQGVPRNVFDAILLLYFDKSMNSYDGASGKLTADKAVASGWDVNGKRVPVLTDLTEESDGSKTGTFLLFVFNEGDTTDIARLQNGYIRQYESHYEKTVNIRFREVEDKETVHLRFVSIKADSAAPSPFAN